MQQLWAPWRMTYIRSEKEPDSGCVFCNKIRGDDTDEQIIARLEHVYVTLNRYPYNNGHLLIVPYAHIPSQEALDTAALTEMMVAVNQSLAVLRRAYNPPAFNIGANLGAAAGAGIAAHYHFHIVPRWPGDTNFMSVVGETRVIPDELRNMYHELKATWDNLHSDA